MENNSTHDNIKDPRRNTVLGRILRFFGWCFGFIGLYSITAVCPCCGQQGCPVGTGIASVIGGFFALLVQDWGGVFKFLYHKMFKSLFDKISRAMDAVRE